MILGPLLRYEGEHDQSGDTGENQGEGEIGLQKVELGVGVHAGQEKVMAVHEDLTSRFEFGGIRVDTPEV